MASADNNHSDNNLKRRNKNDEEEQTTTHQQNDLNNNDSTTMKKDSATLAWIWQYYFYYYYYYNHCMASMHCGNPNNMNTNQSSNSSLNNNNLRNNSNNINNATSFSSSTQVRHATLTPTLNQGVMPASLIKRMFAEMIDFLVIFTIKTVVLTYHGIESKFSQAQLRVFLEDKYNTEDLQLIIVYAIFYRIFVFIVETICLYKGVGNGMTIGKLAVGIQVIACDAIIDDGIAQNNHIQVFPGGGLNWQRAIMRSVIKNFSTMFFFPVILTIMLFKHGRTAYDIVSGTIVIERQTIGLPHHRN